MDQGLLVRHNANGSHDSGACHPACNQRLTLQYAGMLLICPHCQACYSFPEHCAEAEFACCHCRQPLRIEHPLQPDEDFTPNQLLAPLPLQRRDARLWRWFVLMLLLVAGGGFMLQKDAWLDNRWFRSALISIGVDLPARARDWQIEPASIQPRWITRDDDSRVLLIQGKIQNLLSSNMPAPLFLVTFFSADQPDQPLSSSVAHAIRPPQDDNIRSSAFLNPALDLSLISAGSSRPFIILLQNVPDNTADFTLLPTMHH